MNDKITNYLQSGKFFIPDEVVISVPNSREVINSIITSENAGYEGLLRRTQHYLKKEVNDEVLTVDSSKQYYLYINPRAVYNVNLIKKKTTSSNDRMRRLRNIPVYWDICDIVVPNSGWRINNIISKEDLFVEFTEGRESRFDAAEQIIYAEVSHPDIPGIILEKLGYDITAVNIPFVVSLTYSDLYRYVSEFNRNLVFGTFSEKIRFIDKTLPSLLDPDPVIRYTANFIPEDVYQKEKDRSFKLATAIGNQNNVLGSLDQYKLGHIYNLSELAPSTCLGAEGGNTVQLLYIGKIDSAIYDVTRYARPLRGNSFTSINSLPEYLEWSEKSPKLGKSGEYDKYWGYLDIPLDVFLPINYGRSNSGYYYGRTNHPVIKKVLETGNPITETELLDIKIKIYQTLDNLNFIELIDPRFFVFPSIGLSGAKKGQIFENFLSDSPDMEGRYKEKDFKSSYRHFVEITDLGKFVDIKSSAKTILNQLTINIDGAAPDYGRTAKEKSYGETYPRYGFVNINAYNLLSKTDIDNLNEQSLKNIQYNIANYILYTLLDYCKDYLSSCTTSSWKRAYNNCGNYAIPIYSEVTNGLLANLQKLTVIELNKYYARGSKVNQLQDDPDFKKQVYKSIIDLLFDKKEECRLKYLKNGVIDTIEKFKLAKEIFERCTEYLS